LFALCSQLIAVPEPARTLIYPSWFQLSFTLSELST
jgi:hypothetical protein